MAPPSTAAASKRPTHFLCLPLITPSSRPHLSASIAAFNTDATTHPSHGGLGFPQSALRPLGTLHLTLGVMSLTEDRTVAGSGSRGEDNGNGNGNGSNTVSDAVRLLRSLKPRELLADVRAEAAAAQAAAAADQHSDIHNSGGSSSDAGRAGAGATTGLYLTLRGLRSMQDDHRQAAVLYAPPFDADPPALDLHAAQPRGSVVIRDPLGPGPPPPPEILYPFCVRLRAPFLAAGLMQPDPPDKPFKLHCTLVNTTYVTGPGIRDSQRVGGGRGGHGRERGRVVLDATTALARYDDEVWVRGMRVERVAICKMGAKMMRGKDGIEEEQYEVVAEMEI